MPGRGGGRRRQSSTAAALVLLLVIAVGAVVPLVRALQDEGRAGPLVEGRVVHVEPGGVLEVGAARRRSQVRLAGVVVPGQQDCLGPTAQADLAARAPVGSLVIVHPSTDPGELHTLVGRVVTPDGRDVGTDLALAGLAVPVAGAPQEVQDAAEAARRAGVGLHDPLVPCTLPGQVRQQLRTLEEAIAAARVDDRGVGDRSAAAGRLGEAVTSAGRLRTELTEAVDDPGSRWSALSRDELSLLLVQLESAMVGAEVARFGLRAASSP